MSHIIRKSFPLLSFSTYTCNSPPLTTVCLTVMISVQLPTVNDGPEADDPPPDEWSEGQK